MILIWILGLIWIGGLLWFIQEARNHPEVEWSTSASFMLVFWPILFFLIPFIVLASVPVRAYKKVRR